MAFALAALAALPAGARAEYEIDPTTAKVELLNAAGEAETRAGAHPDRMITKFKFTAVPGFGVEANAKDIAFDLPPGMSGNPAATPRCLRSLFAEGTCPADTQVGVLRGTFAGFGEVELGMYNVEPSPDELAEIGFTVILVPARFVISLRQSDYGMRLEASNLTQELPMRQGEIELWGVPADHQTGTSIPRRPFLTTPTRCDGGPLEAALQVRTWERPQTWMTTPLPLPPFEGCGALPFTPSLSVTASSDRADSPTGLRVALDLAQSEDPDGPASTNLRSLTVALPPGFSLSPGVAQGLGLCSDAELGVGDPGPARCPDSAKLGTVEIESPAAAQPIHGSVYLGAPTDSEPFRLFVLAEAPGVAIKLRGVLRADAAGRLTTVLTDLPQLPVSGLVLAFRDGPRAPLASPETCTTGAASAELVPYDGGAPAVVSSEVATISGPDGSPCGRGETFAPSLVAGSSSRRAGADAVFSSTVRRRDGEAAIERLQIALPAGLVARLSDVQRCPDAAVASGSCPPASRIGSTLVEAGAGTAPLPLGGGVYLTGPYRGAPFGLALILRATVGPLDLGVAMVRATMRIDPATARLTVATDPLPEVLGGVPLRLRTVGIDIDRPGFIRNPTSCAPQRIDARVTSVDGVSSWPSVPFQVGGCGRLRAHPNLSLTLLGRSRRPGLQIRLRPSERAANLRSIAIKLPKLLALDSTALTACTRQQFKDDECPPAARVGTASASSPLLPAPLRGPVRLVQAGDVGPPEIWTTLRGEGVQLTTRGTLGVSTGGQLLNSLVGLPDVPLRTLTTRLDGGPGSLIVPRRNPCGVDPEGLLAEATARAQSGAQLTRILRVGLRPACPSAKLRQ